MIDVLIELIILCVVLGLVYYLLTLLPLPEPFPKIIQICIVIIAILFVLSLFLGGNWFPHVGRWR